jgi:hypothetical protein
VVAINTYLYDELSSNAWNHQLINATKFKFYSYIQKNEAIHYDLSETSFLIVDLPLQKLVPKLTVSDLKLVAAAHNLLYIVKKSKQQFDK